MEAWSSLPLRPFDTTLVYDAEGNERQLVWPDGAPSGELVLGFPDPLRFEGAPPGFERMAGRSFLYDDALLAIARVGADDRPGASRVLAALAALQLPDGAWGFSVDGSDGFYDSGYVRSGVVAFVVYAFAKYAARYADESEPWVREAALSGGRWLLAQRDPWSGLIRAGKGWWGQNGSSFSALHIADYAATEHQIDAFFACAALASIDPAGPWSDAATELRERAVRYLWLPDAGRFALGLNSGAIDPASALDASGSWGALFLLACGQVDDAARALEWVERMHRIGGPDWRGYRPYLEGPEVWFVEGSAAIALASHRLAPGAPGALEDLARLDALARSHGFPLVYSTAWAPNFPLTPAAAPTLWYLLIRAELESAKAPFFWSECPAPLSTMGFKPSRSSD
ncbi:hypothetical protein [Vulgatibacter incomptus]|uniref:hypothetical protein n=1 Tax=Vulgatibacter incomptus TaxID=1391653 RepID=UPI000680E48C|nr:hypothetical protein [Vulgatibacter incomptus]